MGQLASYIAYPVRVKLGFRVSWFGHVFAVYGYNIASFPGPVQLSVAFVHWEQGKVQYVV